MIRKKFWHDSKAYYRCLAIMSETKNVWVILVFKYLGGGEATS